MHQIFYFVISSHFFKIVAVKVNLHVNVRNIVQKVPIFRSEEIGIDFSLIRLEIFEQFVDADIEELPETILDGVEGKLDIVAVLLAHDISDLGEITPLDVGDDHGLSLIFLEPSHHFLLLLLPLRQHVHIRTLYYPKNSPVQLQCIFSLYLNLLIVVPQDELVEYLQLVRVLMAQPIPNLRQLSPDRTLLISVQPLDLRIALVAKEFDDFIDGLVIDGFDVASVGFWRHVGVGAGNVLIIDAILDEGLCDIFLFIVLLDVLFLRDIFDPSCLPRREHNGFLCVDLLAEEGCHAVRTIRRGGLIGRRIGLLHLLLHQAQHLDVCLQLLCIHACKHLHEGIMDFAQIGS